MLASLLAGLFEVMTKEVNNGRRQKNIDPEASYFSAVYLSSIVKTRKKLYHKTKRFNDERI